MEADNLNLEEKIWKSFSYRDYKRYWRSYEDIIMIINKRKNNTYRSSWPKTSYISEIFQVLSQVLKEK